MNLPEPFERLVKVLGRLPAIGRRSAERIAIELVRGERRLLGELLSALGDIQANVRCCSRCGALTTKEEDPCRLCTDPARDGALLCIVEDPGDVIRIESSGGWKGRYHVLAGRISPMHAKGAKEIGVPELAARIQREHIREVVLALDTDVEGDATAAYLADLLRPLRVRVSRIAFGLPAGSGIAYSDPVTLARALEGRRGYDEGGPAEN